MLGINPCTLKKNTINKNKISKHLNIYIMIHIFCYVPKKQTNKIK